MDGQKILPIKNLTLKFTILLILTSASRASSIHLLDICFMSFFEEKVVFKFSKLLKAWKKGRAPPKLEIFVFEQGTNLYVIQTLIVYLNRSQEWRYEKKHSFYKSHKPVSVSTVSRWIKNVMPLSGINVSLFKGYSARSASTFFYLLVLIWLFT